MSVDKHNIQKADSPEEALRNLQILGWGPELKKFLNDAVSVYQEVLRNQIEMPSKTGCPQSVSTDKQQQIDSLAKAMCKNYDSCHSCMFSPSCDVKSHALRAYDEGYRKQSDTAKEVFEVLRACGHVNFDKSFVVHNKRFDELERELTKE